MNDSDWFLDDKPQPHTDLHRHLVDGGRTHEITVSADDGMATVRLDITDANGLIVGRISGELPAVGLSTAADLLGAVLGAAGLAHADIAESPLSRLDRKRREHPNHGARWTDDEEALLAARFSAGVPITQLCDEFGRNDNSIRARLVQLGLLAADQWPTALSDRGRAA